ncbi:SRPBCC family protein [Nonomuraea sp. SYSU D8015]|uniref:SRPBCC family protein n=1 Tax=Nonomuraea sp. SYSU D8015 TaxID=2593644 RepID=UPI001660A323|nr:SRPBCC family protein [Nonomuraea sp. SYSU D8015]
MEFEGLVVEEEARWSGDGAARQAARGLGWLSLGLGAVQLAAPRGVSRLAGVDDSAVARVAVRLVGVRELVQAAGLLSGRRPAEWIWMRVAGDVLDVSALGWALNARRGGRRLRAGFASAALVGIAAVDLMTAARVARSRAVTAGGRTMRLERSVTINRPVSEVFSFWRDFTNLPRFMTHLDRVEVLDERHSHWVAKAPMGHVAWDAEIIAEEQDRMIAWRAIGAPGVPNAGQVTFAAAPGGRGTEVRVRLAYRPPGGAVGVALARLAGREPDQQVREDLRRLKQVLECGEVIAVDERVSARGPMQRRVTRVLRRRLATGGRP